MPCRFLWTPKKLWEGIPLPPAPASATEAQVAGRRAPFEGLSVYLQQYKSVPKVYVVAAQCCGSHFADALRALYEADNSRGEQLSIIDADSLCARPCCCGSLKPQHVRHPQLLLQTRCPW